MYNLTFFHYIYFKGKILQKGREIYFADSEGKEEAKKKFPRKEEKY